MKGTTIITDGWPGRPFTKGLARTFLHPERGRITGLEENKELVRRQFELVNAGDAKGAAMLWAPVAFNHGRKVTPKELEAVFASLRTLRERQSLHEIIAEGEWVAVRTTCDGVHAGEPPIPVNSNIFGGLAPTGRAYKVQHMHLFRIIDGKLTEHWANRDDLGAARQVGFELRPVGERGRLDSSSEV